MVVFEKDDRIGGLLRYGIPDFKLEKEVLELRLRQLEAEGVHFETGVEVGRDLHVTQLRDEFDAVLLAGGAQKARELRVPGRELGGVHLAMDYLTQQNRRVAGDVDRRCERDLGGRQAGRRHRRRRHGLRLHRHLPIARARPRSSSSSCSPSRRRTAPSPRRGRSGR